MRNTLNQFVKYLKRLVVALLLLFIIIVLLFSIPGVQTYVAKEITNSLNESYKTDINLERFQISFSGNIRLKGVFIKDHKEDTLIYAERLSSSLLDLLNFDSSNLDFSTTEAENLTFKLQHYKDEVNNNLDLFLNKLSDTTATDTTTSITRFSKILLSNSRVYISNENLSTPEVLELNDLNLNVSDLQIINSDVRLELKRFSAVMGRGIVIDNMQMRFAYSPSQMLVNQLNLETAANSNLNADIKMTYTREDFKDFENQVQIEAEFDKSQVSTSDLKRFYKEFAYGRELQLFGNLDGSLNNFNLTNFNIQGLKSTSYKGEAHLVNSFQSEKGFSIELQHETFQSSREDLMALLPDLLNSNLPPILNKFGDINLTGNSFVDSKTVQFDGIANTRLGNLKTKLKLNNPSDSINANYSANLSTISFNVGELMASNKVKTANFSAQINGSGFTQASINTDLDLNINSLNIKNYDYNSINLKANFKSPQFTAAVTSEDEALKFNFFGSLNTTGPLNAFKIDLDIAEADLNAMNLIKRTNQADFSGKIIADFKGTSIDDAVGSLVLQNFKFEDDFQNYAFDTLNLTSTLNGKFKRININSPDIIDGELSGEFKLTSLPELFSDAFKNLYFRKDDYGENQYQYVDFNFDIYNKVVEVFFPEINLSANTYLKGSLVANQNEFKLNFKSPLVEAYGNRFEKINIQVDNKNPLYNSYVEVDSISTMVYDISKFSMINVSLNDSIFVRSEFKGGKASQDEYNLSLYQTLNDKNQSIFGFRRSSLKFKNNTWFINKNNNANNRILVERDFQNFTVDSIAMRFQDQVMKLAGKTRDSTYKDLDLQFTNVDLDKITPNLDSLKLEGKLNGQLNILQTNQLYKPNLDLKVDSLLVNQFNYGDLRLEANGSKDLNQFSIIANLLKEETYLFDITGDITNKNNAQYADLDISFKDFNIKALSALGGDVVNNFRGALYGDLNLTGKLSEPNINGEVQLYEAGLNIPYLNVDFDFDDDALLTFNQKDIIFENIGLTDTKHTTKGILSGSITHNSLTDWEMGLDISSDNLLVLDTDFERGALYYGTAFINGNAEILGPVDELTINVNAQTQPNTVFKIPLDDTESFADNSFIYFLTPEEKAKQNGGKNIQIEEVKGLQLNFELDITRDAEVEIVVDQSTGSKLNGRGAGTLLIEINTNGKFNMWGDFVAYEGYYDFRYAGNLVQKRFDLVPGSNLTWNGNPVQANMDVQAKYTTSANPAAILENPSINREIPVEVLINLNGQLIQPEIAFELNYPNLSSVVKSELEYRIQGTENMEYQALSLITQGTFYSQQMLGQNALTGNLIESASGIFDKIISNDDNKFKLGLDYVQTQRTPTQNQTGDRFGFTLQTQLSKRIFVNSRFGVPIGNTTESVIFGDVEVSFLLNESGSLRATAFNRESNIQFIGEELGYTQGVGLSYTVDFNSFKELVQRIFNQEIKANREEEEENTVKSSIKIPSYIKFPRTTTSRTIKE